MIIYRVILLVVVLFCLFTVVEIERQVMELVDRWNKAEGERRERQDLEDLKNGWLGL